MPVEVVDNIFARIRDEVPPHPLPAFKNTILKYVLMVHLPVILIGAAILVYVTSSKKVDKKQEELIGFIFGGIVLLLSFGLVIVVIAKSFGYEEKLTLRQDNLNLLLSSLNENGLSAHSVNASAGKFGAWIELKFGQECQMIPVGNQTVVSLTGGKDFAKSDGDGYTKVPQE